MKRNITDYEIVHHIVYSTRHLNLGGGVFQLEMPKIVLAWSWANNLGAIRRNGNTNFARI